MYYDLKTKKKITIGEIRKDNPNVSLPAELNDATLESMGYAKLIVVKEENTVGEYSKLVNKGISLIDGIYTETYGYEADPTQEIKIATKYLADTDWYVVRLAETAIVVPEDIAKARADARIKIETLRGK